MSSKKFYFDREEEILDNFIDDLNEDQKPRIYKKDEDKRETLVTPEMEEDFEMIRKLKRVQQLEGEIETNEKVRGKSWYKRHAFKGAVIAACFLLLFLFEGIFTDDGNATIVKAMVDNYERISGYRAEVNVTSIDGGEVTQETERNIKFKKPDLYRTEETWDDIIRTNISDGETLWMIVESKDSSVKNFTKEPLFPEKELWRYHLGTQISDVADAELIKEIGVKEIAGRNARGIKYKYEEKEEHWHEVWIDEEEEFPLKSILRGGYESKLVVEYRELELDPSFDSNIFCLDIDTSEYEKRDTTSILLENKEELSDLMDREVYSLKKAKEDSFKQEERLKLNKVGYMDIDWIYQGILRYQDKEKNDFLDIYQGEAKEEPMHLYGESQVGSIGDGNMLEYRESVTSTFNINYPGVVNILRFRVDAKGEGKNEIALVSNLPKDILVELAESLTGEKVEFF